MMNHFLRPSVFSKLSLMGSNFFGNLEYSVFEMGCIWMAGVMVKLSNQKA